MDWFIQTHGKERLIVPKTSNADGSTLLRYYLLDIGVPLSSLAAGSRGYERLLFTDFTKRTRKFSTASDIINARRKKSASDNAVGFKRGELLDVVLKVMHGNKASGPRGSRTCSDITITGLQLLRSFKEDFIAEESQMNFSYFGFWTTCAKLLNKLMV